MLTVPRAQFIAWTNGTLLDFENGSGIIVDELACEAAKAALDKGETIGLLIKGRIVTTMRLVDGSYQEEPFSH